MGYDFNVRQESYSTFLHPDGLPEDTQPYVTNWGLILPGIITSKFELEVFKDYVQNISEKEASARPLPTIRQLGRIALNIDTGCWELPIYKDGLDVHPESNARHKAGQPRARYGSLMVKGANNKPTDHLAHRTMYRIMRGPILEGNHIDHLCRNPKCCYHRHLEDVSSQENTNRIYEARRRTRQDQINE